MIYLDNAATTWPKPKDVKEQMVEYLTSFGGNPGRGGHGSAVQASRAIYRVREELAGFFGLNNPNNIVFTGNATQALNQALFGLLRPGDHVITSSLEHNAVSRPLAALASRGIQITEIPIIPGQEFPWAALRAAFRANTRMVVTIHASNVTGTILPIEGIGQMAREYGALYLVDAAQTAGVFPIDLRKLPVDVLAVPGHKGLLGPQGTGALMLNKDLVLTPLVYGGTGSMSELDQQPDFLPDALESGTLNGVGIIGLGAGVRYLTDYGIENIRNQEQQLCQRLIDGLQTIEGLRLYSGTEAATQAPIVAFNIGDIDSTLVGFALEQAGGIIARAGLHCAPHAHATLGTTEQGVVRFSPSHLTTVDEINQAVQTVAEVAADLL